MKKVLQTAVYKLEQLGKEHNLEISITRRKVVAFQGKFPVRPKTVTNNHPMQ
jgi:hypothetical protein